VIITLKYLLFITRVIYSHICIFARCCVKDNLL